MQEWRKTHTGAGGPKDCKCRKGAREAKWEGLRTISSQHMLWQYQCIPSYACMRDVEPYSNLRCREWSTAAQTCSLFRQLTIVELERDPNRRSAMAAVGGEGRFRRNRRGARGCFAAHFTTHFLKQCT
eukprot:2495955-Pleurochrysis_carterae.AAC.3